MSPQDAADQLVRAVARHLKQETNNIRYIDVAPKEIGAWIYELNENGEKFVHDDMVAIRYERIPYRYARGTVQIEEFE